MDAMADDTDNKWPLEELRDPRTGEHVSTAARYRKGPSARILLNAEYDDSLAMQCYQCGWEGKAGEGSREYYDELFDVSCPKCDTMLLVVGFA